jgi:hypothetical protein
MSTFTNTTIVCSNNGWRMHPGYTSNYNDTTLTTDPWANQQLFKYDNTLRAAYSPDEIREANQNIDSLTIAQGLTFYSKTTWRMYTSSKNSKNVEKYA